jgi:catechol 2,3-dioxygenase-like lactoylglutathione lyase family enzyme
MEIQRLEHININVADLDASVAFYRDVIGLEQGIRPNFKNKGAWLYAGEIPIVHLTYGRCEAQVGSGTFDHFALRAHGSEAFIDNLKKKNVDFDERRVPDQRIHQIFIKDPDGIIVEINFDNEMDVGHLDSRQ